MKQTLETPSLAKDEPRRAVVRLPGEGRVYTLPSGPQVAKITRDEAEGAYELIEIEAVPNSGPPLHVHREFDESFYVVSGVLTVRLGLETVELVPGSTVMIPAGMVHTWKNATTENIRFVQFTAPGYMEALTAELSEKWRSVTPHEFAAIADRHGTTIVGPPL